MFNLSGSEIVVILLLALVVLGPEKLPEAMRRAGKTYAEIKKLSSGFQDEVRKGFDEPAREVKKTAAAVKSAARMTTDTVSGKSKVKPRYNPATDATPEPPAGSSVAEPLAAASPNVVDTTAEEVPAQPTPEIADVAEVDDVVAVDVVAVDVVAADAPEVAAVEIADVADADGPITADAPEVAALEIAGVAQVDGVVAADTAVVAGVVAVDSELDATVVDATPANAVAAHEADSTDSTEADRTA